MYSRNMSVIIAILFVLGCSSFGAVYTDTFDVDHDYLADGTSGTIWDGFVYNDGLDATQNTVVTVAAATGGGLNMRSRRGNWEGGADDGLLLYIDVPAGNDFIANVYVSDYTYIDYHDVGLMARVGGTKDYVMHRHFDAYGIRNRIRSTNDGITDNNFPSSATLSPYLQLEKAGPLFTIRTSSDGITYTHGGSVSRGDMIGVPLQVGLYQATFSNNTGNVTFDDFSIDIYEEGSIEKTTYWPNDFNNYPEVTTERSAESANFVIYWGEKCGLDPTTASNPSLRFNPSDVLAMMEGFYDTYINQLGFLDDSFGNISLYKFILVMNDTWNKGNWGGWAFGAHYDNVIGAMWIHPAGCQPPSGVVAHEFAHALQCQSFIQYPGTGFHHYPCGFFWEAHANFMMLQCYPDNWNGVDLVNFMNHQHFHYSSTRHRYNNMLFQQYIKDKRGIEMINRMWRESDAATEHPLQTYMRLTGMTQPQLNDEFGEYAMKNVNFDYSVGEQIRYSFNNEFALDALTRRFTMLEPMSGQANAYKVPYYMAPQDYGYNIIQLDPDSPTATIDMKFYGQRNNPAGGAEYRFGFVALDGSTSRHSELYAAAGGMEIPASFTMQANETELYLVVLGAPAVHHNYYWEEGWPKYYRYPWQIQITGATPFVNNHKYTAGSNHPNGGGFVANTATVAPTVYVGPNAVVLGNSRVEGNARIEDMASVIGWAVVKDEAIVRHAAFTGWSTIKDSAVLEETATQIGKTVGGTYVGGGDATGHADCYSGTYRQEPNGNNGRTACDGLTTHTANNDINPTFTDYIFNGAPEVDAGDDIVTWLVGGTVTETVDGALVADDGIPAAAATVWTVDPTTDATVVSPASLATDVTITAVGTYTMTLTADDTEKIGADTMKIRVYADACEAAKIENGYTVAVANARGDFDYNCMVDLNDFSTFSSEWLVSLDLNDMAYFVSEWLVSSEYVKP